MCPLQTSNKVLTDNAVRRFALHNFTRKTRGWAIHIICRSDLHRPSVLCTGLDYILFPSLFLRGFNCLTLLYIPIIVMSRKILWKILKKFKKGVDKRKSMRYNSKAVWERAKKNSWNWINKTWFEKINLKKVLKNSKKGLTNKNSWCIITKLSARRKALETKAWFFEKDSVGPWKLNNENKKKPVMTLRKAQRITVRCTLRYTSGNSRICQVFGMSD